MRVRMHQTYHKSCSPFFSRMWRIGRNMPCVIMVMGCMVLLCVATHVKAESGFSSHPAVPFQDITESTPTEYSAWGEVLGYTAVDLKNDSYDDNRFSRTRARAGGRV